MFDDGNKCDLKGVSIVHNGAFSTVERLKKVKLPVYSEIFHILKSVSMLFPQMGQNQLLSICLQLIHKVCLICTVDFDSEIVTFHLQFISSQFHTAVIL